MLQIECTQVARAIWLLVILFWVYPNALGQKNPAQPRSACSCPDGRQFSVGASLFGKNSARVVITGFHRDLVQIPQQQGLPQCKDLMVVGQTVHLEMLGNRPFLRRETSKRGAIKDICQTTIQFVQPSKSYDFFADDGSAVTLSDMEKKTLTNNKDNVSQSDDLSDADTDDLTGKDLIRMMPLAQSVDPATASFDASDLKEGAYFIVPRSLKGVPAASDSAGGTGGKASEEHIKWTVPAGCLGHIDKRAGFRDEPLWVVDIVPNSAPLPFSLYLRSLPSTFRKHQRFPKKFVLASSEIVEINHFFDKYSLEFTRVGNDTDDARGRDFAGTTILPKLYSAPQLALEDNLENARRARIEEQVSAAAMRLGFSLKDPNVFDRSAVLVIDEKDRSGIAKPNFFHRQCFAGEHQAPPKFQIPKTSDARAFHITVAELAIFQPGDSVPVPRDYYAVDLRLLLRSDFGDTIPIVCRFPSAAIEITLLDSAERLLSRIFEISRD